MLIAPSGTFDFCPQYWGESPLEFYTSMPLHCYTMVLRVDLSRYWYVGWYRPSYMHSCRRLYHPVLLSLLALPPLGRCGGRCIATSTFWLCRKYKNNNGHSRRGHHGSGWHANGKVSPYLWYMEMQLFSQASQSLLGGFQSISALLPYIIEVHSKWSLFHFPSDSYCCGAIDWVRDTQILRLLEN